MLPPTSGLIHLNLQHDVSHCGESVALTAVKATAHRQAAIYLIGETEISESGLINDGAAGTHGRRRAQGKITIMKVNLILTFTLISIN